MIGSARSLGKIAYAPEVGGLPLGSRGIGLRANGLALTAVLMSAPTSKDAGGEPHARTLDDTWPPSVFLFRDFSSRLCAKKDYVEKHVEPRTPPKQRVSPAGEHGIRQQVTSVPTSQGMIND